MATDSHSHSPVHGHPQPMEYIIVAVVLTFITAIEVALFYVGGGEAGGFSLSTAAILVLSTFKFVVVVGWYMHLKFDPKLFTYFFAGGLALAGLVLFSLMFLMPGIAQLIAPE